MPPPSAAATLYRSAGATARGSTLEDLARQLSPLGVLERNRFLLRVVIDKYQLTVFADGRAIISGTYDLLVAKSLYARYVGT